MRPFIIALSILVALANVNTACADQRIALVVGNGSYVNVDRLANPASSAAAMERFLRQFGFDVVVGIDLTREQFTQQLQTFGAKAKNADLALFYYAGHGIAVGGNQLLVPVDADIKAATNPTLGGAIKLDLAIDIMGDAKVKVILLDASRDNPGRSPAVSKSAAAGGAASPSAGLNTLIAFATGPGQAASDGTAGAVRPFTQALIDQIGAPGVEIGRAMSKARDQLYKDSNGKQISWGTSNIAGEVYLNPAAAPARTPSPDK